MHMASPTVSTPISRPVSQSAEPIQWSGRLRDESATDADRHYAVAMHLCPCVATLLMSFFPFALAAPIVIWLIRKDESVFHDDHGREVINFSLSFLLLHIILLCTVIGVMLWPVLWVIGLVNVIRGAIAGGRGEYFRYPLTWRFLS